MMLFCLLSHKMETVCAVIVVFSRCVFMKIFQIICLYDPNKCATSCLVFCWATGKVFSMIALQISTYSFSSNWSRVSLQRGVDWEKCWALCEQMFFSQCVSFAKWTFCKCRSNRCHVVQQPKCCTATKTEMLFLFLCRYSICYGCF